MIAANDLNSLNDFEDEIIHEFKDHPVLIGISSLPQHGFEYLLLQRRFLSFAFTTMYDLAIDALRDDEAKKIARYILREEYPSTSPETPSHREDLSNDLKILGFSKSEIIKSVPSTVTTDTIQASLGLIVGRDLDEVSDVGILTALRLWGEVLVSIEYGQYWKRIHEMFERNGRNISAFYYPHHIHDAKKKPLTSMLTSATTHSDKMAVRLVRLLNSESAYSIFRETEKKVYKIKYHFYDQFTPLLEQ